MKKLVLICLVTTLGFVSCKKEVIEKNTTTGIYTENGIAWKGYTVTNPVTTIDSLVFYYFDKTFYVTFLGTNMNKSVASIGTKTVQIVGVEIDHGSWLSVSQISDSLKNRGWKLAPYPMLWQFKGIIGGS